MRIGLEIAEFSEIHPRELKSPLERGAQLRAFIEKAAHARIARIKRVWANRFLFDMKVAAAGIRKSAEKTSALSSSIIRRPAGIRRTEKLKKFIGKARRNGRIAGPVLYAIFPISNPSKISALILSGISWERIDSGDGRGIKFPARNIIANAVRIEGNTVNRARANEPFLNPYARLANATKMKLGCARIPADKIRYVRGPGEFFWMNRTKIAREIIRESGRKFSEVFQKSIGRVENIEQVIVGFIPDFLEKTARAKNASEKSAGPARERAKPWERKSEIPEERRIAEKSRWKPGK